MTITEALAFFQNLPSITRQLQTLEEVGLGYVKLGQPSTQLSGGEAQRVKLAFGTFQAKHGQDDVYS